MAHEHVIFDCDKNIQNNLGSASNRTCTSKSMRCNTNRSSFASLLLGYITKSHIDALRHDDVHIHVSEPGPAQRLS